MINHVIFEGYLVRTWEFRGNRFLRLACHHTLEDSNMIYSDYVTVQLATRVTLNRDFPKGTRLVVTGKIWGRDILEPLGKVIQKARIEVDLPAPLENLIIPRPTVQILATEIEILGSTTSRRPRRTSKNSSNSQIQDAEIEVDKDKVDQLEENSREEEQSLKSYPKTTDQVHPGVDLADVVVEIT